eukprot:CAMPEP_0198146046 /NCGR_PEP_ID=MMETSP1443-20131203/27047_1 /TAXON_ID=186043 /ORGANISM="Entomoneis sp., Strain CCMP2396" /LENGTH=121 /DNA_ID=CAMNT_0043809863 /DNA_START=87 /DNA_END=449 /DNA_ORIENTATION=+
MANSRFVFPELVSESAVALRYDPPTQQEQQDDSSGGTIMYKKQQPEGSNSSSSSTTSAFPLYYHESKQYLTHLTSSQFYACATMGFLNLVGVLWFRQATSPNGVLQEVVEFRYLAKFLAKW